MFLKLESPAPVVPGRRSPPLTLSCDYERVIRALLLMEQNINRPIPIDGIAARLQISRRHLERVFERQTGLAPRTVYRKLRLKHARWMLCSCKSLAVVAVETCFANSSRLFAALRRTYVGDSNRYASTNGGIGVKRIIILSAHRHRGQPAKQFDMAWRASTGVAC